MPSRMLVAVVVGKGVEVVNAWRRMAEMKVKS